MVHPPTLSPPACYFCKIIIIEKSVRKSFKPLFNVLASDKISDMGDWEGAVLAQNFIHPWESRVLREEKVWMSITVIGSTL